MRRINVGVKMTPEEKNARAVIICRNCITYSAYMSYLPHGRKPVGAIEFWEDTYRSFLFLFVIDWCILLKKSRNNYLHWGNLIPLEKHDRFYSLLLQEVDISAEQFENYKENVVSFRDSIVAHMDDDVISMNAPSAHIGNKAVCFLYDFLLSTGSFPDNFPTSKMPKSYVLWNERAQQAEDALTLKQKPEVKS